MTAGSCTGASITALQQLPQCSRLCCGSALLLLCARAMSGDGSHTWASTLAAIDSLISGKRRSDGKNWAHAFDLMTLYLEVRLAVRPGSLHMSDGVMADAM